MGKYFRYGLIGNLIFYGGSVAVIGYISWLIWDMNENNSVKMSSKLFKETFMDVTQQDLNQIVKKGKYNQFIKKQSKEEKTVLKDEEKKT